MERCRRQGPLPRACFSTRLLSTAVRAEHRPRPHSDERPSLPGWDVSSSQTPASHHAPVTVATYSCAHRPRGPRQGGLPSHINIFCRRSGVGELVGVNLGCSLFLSVLTSAVNLSRARCKSLTVRNERITAPSRPSGPTPTDAVLAVLPFLLKLLRKFGKDCPRFKSLMTETFESQPYQKYLKNHQVRNQLGNTR